MQCDTRPLSPSPLNPSCSTPPSPRTNRAIFSAPALTFSRELTDLKQTQKKAFLGRVFFLFPLAEPLFPLFSFDSRRLIAWALFRRSDDLFRLVASLHLLFPFSLFWRRTFPLLPSLLNNAFKLRTTSGRSSTKAWNFSGPLSFGEAPPHAFYLDYRLSCFWTLIPDFFLFCGSPPLHF